MILNSYAVLIVFVAVVRLVLALVVLGMGVIVWRWLQPASPESRVKLEDRCYLVFLLTFLLVVLDVMSWPLFYLLLQSYVKEWQPEVMCIYGVTQIGSFSLGPSRFLPVLLHWLQMIKPAVVFAGGAWYVLYLLNRRTETAPLLPRLLLGLLPLGLLAAADSAAELTYIAIPKKEEFPAAGCCVNAAPADSSRFLPAALIGAEARPWLFFGFFAANLILIGLLFLFSRRGFLSRTFWAMASLVGGGIVALAVSALFLVEIAAPELLHWPEHHCIYDLLPRAPLALVPIAFYGAAFFVLAWAGTAALVGRTSETSPFLQALLPRMTRLSAVSYLAAVAILSLELALA